MAVNPFTPTFGAPPPLLVGRSDLLDEYQDALDQGPGSPGYVTIFTGARGVGKTVMLNAAEDIAREAGFAVISETATAGLLDRVVNHHLPALLPKPRRKISGLSGGPGGVGVTLAEGTERTPLLRQQVRAATLGAPLLLTIDEVHAGAVDDLRQIAAVLQHAIRNAVPFAFCAAGLPAAVNDLLNDDVLTFLRRADRHSLESVRPSEVRRAFVDVLSEHGKDIDPLALATLVESTAGYPYMIQLVGYHTWRAAGGGPITVAHAAAGVEAARRRVGRLVIEPSLNDLSPVDRTFLRHMASDEGPSSMRELADRLGVDSNYASQYRLRLIAAGVIVSVGYGQVDLALPGLREWLREHDVFDE